MLTCPDCGSEKVRRGGSTIWMIYVVLVAVAIPAVLILKLNAAIVAGIMIAAIAAAHLVLNQRVCVDCGHQWKG
jgi:ribosomal protein L37AE/L43A